MFFSLNFLVNNKSYNILIKTFLLSLLLAISCTKKKNSLSIKEEKLFGKKIFENKYNIFNTYFLDDLLLIRNIPDKNTPVFSLFKTEGEKYIHIADFGKTGNGPNEFENEVYYTNQYNNQNGEIKIWVYEMNRSKYSQINISKTLKTRKVILDEEIRIKPGLSFQDLFLIDDNRIVGNSDNLSIKMSRLTFYNPFLDSVTKRIELDTKIENLKKNDLNYTQQSYNPIFLNILRFNSKKNKLVSAMVSLDKIDIFDENGNLEKSIFNSENIVSEVEEYISNPKTYYSDLVLTDNFIYTLYSGDFTSNYYDKSTSTKIKIYDWNYNLKAVFDLSESLNFISVDEKNKKIIGVSITQEKTVEYSLKNLL